MKFCYFILILLRISSCQLIAYYIDNYESKASLESGFMEGYQTLSILHFRFFGLNNYDKLQIAFTQHIHDCSFIERGVVDVKKSIRGTSVAKMIIPEITNFTSILYFCVKIDDKWVHQGSEKWLTLSIYRQIFPIWLVSSIIILCILASSLFNGLSLGLMMLDETELMVIQNSGTEKEKTYAKSILPVRRLGNILLCALLIGTTIFNSIFTVMLDNYFLGYVAVIASTVVIVIFCEIIPCALVSRFGLLIGAKTICLTKSIICCTYPISFTLGKTLDRIIGKEITIYTRERIKELVKKIKHITNLIDNKVTQVYTKMQEQEVDIIQGALDMNIKKASDAMVPLNEVFMLPLNSYLDYETIIDIMKSGYSRIPVFDGERSNIVSILFTKDLAILDPEDRIHLKTLIQIYSYDFTRIIADTTLDVLFQIFKEGQQGHMAIIYDSEEYKETIGIITLEDVIEELIQSEIYDEKDINEKIRDKSKKVKKRLMFEYLTSIAEKVDAGSFTSGQMRISARLFLSSEIEAFSEIFISKNVLINLLKLNSIYHMTRRSKMVIFCQERAKEGFLLILEGHVTIIVGKERMITQGGPFSNFGIPTLLGDPDYIYEYTVESDSQVKYLKISRELYLAAVNASECEKENKPPSSTYLELFGVRNFL